MRNLRFPMKRTLFTTLLSAISLLAASQSALAATKKADARATELVAALQAVSPDPLGGRLGLAAATVRAVPLAAIKGSRNVTGVTNPDERAYLIWKSTQKS